MKLSTKLTLFITGSKIAIVIFFILLLPFLVKQIASNYTVYSLRSQKSKVLANIQKNGLDYYFQGDDNYGSYTMLKEEYISLEPASNNLLIDTIKTAQRIVENDTLNYRVLSHTFKNKGKNYLLEIGKTTASIDQYNQSLQRFALYVLIILIAISIAIDLFFTRKLISPLTQIIKTRLLNNKFPFASKRPKIATSTTDFKYLDESISSLMDQINEAFAKEREFTANASHEFMTPISILQNKMENLLGDESTNAEAQLAIVDMMKTLERLKKISRSLLLISRIDNEQFIKRESVEPVALFKELAEEMDHRLQEKSIQLEFNLVHNRLLNNVNHDLLFQLFYNLINNSIKFNRKNGKIVVTDHYEHNQYSISVWDNGIGIQEHLLPQIFDRFKKSGHPENTGYGLGLAIVKSIVSYLELKIAIQSVPDQETNITIYFNKS